MTLQAFDRAGNASAIASVRFDVSIATIANSQQAPAPAPALGVLVDAPIQDVIAGQVFPTEVIATNNGDVAAEGTVVETSLPDGIDELVAYRKVVLENGALKENWLTEMSPVRPPSGH